MQSQTNAPANGNTSARATDIRTPAGFAIRARASRQTATVEPSQNSPIATFTMPETRPTTERTSDRPSWFQLTDGSSGILDKSSKIPPLRRRTSAQRRSGSSVKASSFSAGSRIQSSRSSSPSSCPAPQPA
jgi:hypothetical protein